MQPRLYVFADEAGDFEFAKKANVSRYFILCTISTNSCDVGSELIALRRKLVWDGQTLGDYFHATKDLQIVRDAVFSLLQKHDFRVQATIMEKSKAQPQVRKSQARFYKTGWYFHFKHVAPKILKARSELMVTTASLGNKKERASFISAVDDVMAQIVQGNRHVTNVCPAASDPCLQVADYCAWALQRKWERADVRSYDLIKDRITYEYDLWAHGDKHFY